MASVKVAVRVRPFNQREKDMNAKLIVQMEGKKTRLVQKFEVAEKREHIKRHKYAHLGPTYEFVPFGVETMGVWGPAARKLAKEIATRLVEETGDGRAFNSKEQNEGNRERYKDFTFDHSYWSYDTKDGHYASQEQVFSDLGVDVIDSAFEGYNACVFAYGQTGSGKTFTMMGSPDNLGLIPRICRQLFSRVSAGKESGASYRTEVSYLEIYNERVKDLLATDAGHSLRVREHPKLGPYVQDLSRHLVSDYDDIQECMHRGNLHRTTASTQMNDVSSRSHAIFTVTFVQASYLKHTNMPLETVSKVHLVDLAGSERADATGATGQRLVEGAHINKSLVTLGSVISALADSSQQSNDKSTPKSGKKVFIPYRDSVLTWLLKDSLGGNSKTIMIAAISPADCNYGETLSTLRYANRAKNIINKPTINEDPNVKLIRELREEIENLRKQITHNNDPIDTESGVLATLQRKEAQEKVLTEKWTEKWRETQQILQEQKALGLRKSGLGVVLDSDMPHLVGIDDNLLSTGVTLYHLKEGETVIGTEDYSPTPDIVVSGAGVLPLHCSIVFSDGVATLLPAAGAQCWLNTVPIDRPAKLSQGCILLLGRTNMFRYNDPAEAAKLRLTGGGSIVNLSRLSLLSWSTTDLALSCENLSHTLSDIEGDARSDRMESQRAELEREREQFLLQQEERQRRWHVEREELLQAQRELDLERESMEREYAAACRRLSGDWRALERGWATRRRALRQRQKEIAGRTRRLTALRDTHCSCVVNEEAHVSALRRRIEEREAALKDYATCSAKELTANGVTLPQDMNLDRDPVECLSHLLHQCDHPAAQTIRDTVHTHKKELLDLDEELQSRVASIATHRAKIDKLQAELALLSAQELGLTSALQSDLSPTVRGDESPSPCGVKRSKSELVLRPRLEPPGSLSDCEHDPMQSNKMSLSLSLEPLPSPSTVSGGVAPSPVSPSQHPLSAELPPDSAQLAPDSVELAPDSAEPFITATPTHFRLGPADSDDTSGDDWHKPRIVDGQSSTSSMERSDERHQRARHRRRNKGEGKVPGGRRPVTEAEALRAMQRLCARIARQKVLVICSLENDCSKEELNRQIAVLQELQKKYVRLEMALQYSFFECPEGRRPTVVTPIQETPSLTLSESDMHISTDSTPDTTGGDDPLTRLREQELEASDNVSTSNDELPSESEVWDDPLRRPGIEPATAAAWPQACVPLDTRTELLDVPLPEPVSPNGLTHPINFDEVISIPGWVTRGAGASTHHEYEVRISVGDTRWQLLRRYRRFRDLYLTARAHYGNKVSSIPFPPRQLWSSPSLARARRPRLEQFLRRLLAACANDPRCPFHRQPLTKHTLVSFSPFFRKGVFESGKCGTG